jgi:MerR family transcriptional regulator, mercuric resistance operon regulatory protein
MRDAADETTPALPIGLLAKRTGLTVEGIRFYEKAGILPARARTAGRHRLYSRADLKRLTFIRRARQLGFTLDEVRALLRLADTVGDHSCADVHRLATNHLDDVRAKLADLKKMEKVLRRMVASCAEGTLPKCPLIETLSEFERMSASG